MANNIGTLIVSPIRPQGETDVFPTVYANEALGGHHQVLTDNARDNISSLRLSEGMLVTVLSSATNGNAMTTYQLSGGSWIDYLSQVKSNSNIFYWDNNLKAYTPYSASTSGKFDNSNTNPNDLTRLNYNGSLYVTSLSIQELNNTTGLYLNSSNGTNLSNGIFISNTGNNGVNGIYIDNNDSNSGNGINIINNNIGDAIFIQNNSNGYGLYIKNTLNGTPFIINNNITDIFTITSGGSVNIPLGSQYLIGGIPLSTGTTLVPNSDILLWNSATTSYTPYNIQSNGVFDTSTDNPISSIRLNYNGNLYTNYLTLPNVVNGYGALTIYNNSVSGYGSYIINNSAGTGTYIVNNSYGLGLEIDNNSNGYGININNTIGIPINISDGSNNIFRIDNLGNVNIVSGANYMINGIPINVDLSGYSTTAHTHSFNTLSNTAHTHLIADITDYTPGGGLSFPLIASGQTNAIKISDNSLFNDVGLLELNIYENNTGIFIHNSGTSNNNGITINNLTEGVGLYLNNSSSNNALLIDNNLNSIACQINNYGSGKGIDISNNADGTGLSIYNDNSLAGTLIYVENYSDINPGISILNGSENNGLYIYNNSIGYGTQIINSGSSIGVGLFIENHNDTGVNISNSNTSGNPRSGLVVNSQRTVDSGITMYTNDGYGLVIENQNYNTAININTNDLYSTPININDFNNTSIFKIDAYGNITINSAATYYQGTKDITKIFENFNANQPVIRLADNSDTTGYTNANGLITIIKNIDDGKRAIEIYNNMIEGDAIYINNNSILEGVGMTIVNSGNTSNCKGVDISNYNIGQGIYVANYNSATGQTIYNYDTGTAFKIINGETTGSKNILVTDIDNNPLWELDNNNNIINYNTIVPPSSSASGIKGTITWDANYIYVCTATDTWKKTSLSIDGTSSGNTSFTLSAATNSILGGVKIGSNINVLIDGTISINDYSITGHTHISDNITNLNSYSGFTNYYNKTNMNIILSGYTLTGHTHTLNDIINSHIQNTDTGTTSNSYLLGSNASTPILLSNSSGTLSIRNSTDTSYLNFNALTIKSNGQIGSNMTIINPSTTGLTIDFNSGNSYYVTLDNNCTITLQNPIFGFSYIIILKQDGTGGRTVTWANSAIIKWPDGILPTLTGSINRSDMVTLLWQGTYYFATIIKNYN